MPIKLGVPLLSVIEPVCMTISISVSLCKSPNKVLLLVRVMIQFNNNRGEPVISAHV